MNELTTEIWLVVPNENSEIRAVQQIVIGK